MKRIFFFLFVVGGALLIAFNAGDLIPRLHMPRQIGLTALVVTILFQGIFWLTLSLTWVTLLDEVAATRISLWYAFCQQAIVSLGKYFPGKVWGMIARGGQMHVSGMDLAAVAKVTYLEQLFLLHSGVVLSGALALGIYDDGPVRLLAFLAVLSAPLAALLHERILKAFIAVLRKIWSGGGTAEVAQITAAGYLRFLSGYGLAWLVSGCVFAGIYVAFIDGTLTAPLLAVLILANAVGIWMGFVAFFAPGGIGVREAASIAVLLPFMPLEHAVMLSLLSRVWLMLMDAVSGLAALWSFRGGKGE